MGGVLSCLVERHDWRIASFAILACVFSLAIALLLAERARRLSPRTRRAYTLSAPLVGGLGVWTTHFIAMLAYDVGVEIRYDALQTFLSLVIVTAAFWVGMHLHLAGGAGWRRRSGLAAAAVVTAGVAAMHFVGMDAMRLSGAVLAWNAPRAVLAVAGGLILFSAVALLPSMGKWKQLTAATLLTSGAVAWLHFVAMAAVSLTPAPGVLLPSQAASAAVVALWITLGVVLTVVVAAFFTGMIWWSRRSVLGQLLEAVHAMPDGVGVYDADDRLVLWNQRYSEIHPHLISVLRPGVTFREVLEVGMKAGVYPDAAGREEAWITERLACRRAPIAPREMQVAGRWLRVQDRPTVGGGAVTVCSDISDLKRNAEALAEARDAAEAANRAKSRFLANMSHEIRTPLNGVIGVAQALTRTELSQHQQEMLELIQSSSRTLQTLLSDILDLARVESGRLELKEEPLDLARTVEEAALLYAAAARDKGLQFIVEVAPEAQVWTYGDPVRLKQVLTNLVSNAVKFTASGFVSLTVDAVPTEAPQTLRFVVQDTGIGFDALTQARLFNRFEQADGDITRHYGGSGLGLAICRELAAMMGGDLGCESEPGAGAAFILSLPLKLAQAPAIPLRPAPKDAAMTSDEKAAPRRLRILAADDHPTNRRVVELILDSAAFDLVSVENGVQAVEAYRAQTFDLVLMDMQMPVMDGLSAVREIRLHEAVMGLPHVPVVMLTANALAQHLDEALAAGADRHMAKPFSVEDLLAMVSDLTAQTPQAAEAAA
ncbi:diguanylate cyclase/phosphodiesterase (GGDEF & EAL domains) with PAS/PAC sensor(s) [Brevundimonas diminuta 3F5N]|uniref:Sensory/regulatory protein RpfC n=1 Tax=Brevundimonas diminuta 3F5N TaxID=1255603 RepID=A0A1R4FLC8_BREDI|nr:ATP-binding protein [Brevundimonas diminuta]SJM56696.1 diguanylate cyclase/phosphodiesterase (GGDEF & EAL domains) with PAS/PAC sensor(s) [Brevundimonas diminuta 3F5N]